MKNSEAGFREGKFKMNSNVTRGGRNFPEKSHVQSCFILSESWRQLHFLQTSSNNCWGHAFPRRSINNAHQHQKDSIECFLTKPIFFSFREARVMTPHLRIHLPNQSTFQSSPRGWEPDPLFSSVRRPSNLSRSLTSQEAMVKAPSLPFGAFCKI